MDKAVITMAIAQVRKQWEEANFPDQFHKFAHIRGQSLYVTILQRETYPQGGTSYDVYVRDGLAETSNLLTKERISVVWSNMVS